MPIVLTSIPGLCEIHCAAALGDVSVDVLVINLESSYLCFYLSVVSASL